MADRKTRLPGANSLSVKIHKPAKTGTGIAHPSVPVHCFRGRRKKNLMVTGPVFRMDVKMNKVVLRKKLSALHAISYILIYIIIILVSLEHMHESYHTIRIFYLNGFEVFGSVAADYLFDDKVSTYWTMILLFSRDIFANILIVLMICFNLVYNKTTFKIAVIFLWSFQFIGFFWQKFFFGESFSSAIGFIEPMYIDYFEVYIPLCILFTIIHWNKLKISNAITSIKEKSR